MKNINTADATYAPNDWKNTRQIALACNITNNVARRTIGTLGNLETKKFLDCQGKERVFYSPKSVEIIKNAVNNHTSKKAPKHWRHAQHIAKDCDVPRNKIVKIINLLGNLETKEYLDRQNKARIYYSPKSVKIIKNVVNEHKLFTPAPTSWKNVCQIAAVCNLFDTTIKRTIGTLDNLETKKFLDCQGKVRVYYSLKSVEIICNVVKAARSAPSGWKVVHQIALELDISTTITRKIIGTLSNLESVKCGGGKKPRTYYSPKSVEIIKEAVDVYKSINLLNKLHDKTMFSRQKNYPN